ncbi:hypothetical protein BKA93DRAFT_802311 [Sparassis latifolia]
MICIVIVLPLSTKSLFAGSLRETTSFQRLGVGLPTGDNDLCSTPPMPCVRAGMMSLMLLAQLFQGTLTAARPSPSLCGPQSHTKWSLNPGRSRSFFCDKT